MGQGNHQPQKHELPSGQDFVDFVLLEMNERGMYIQRSREDPDQVREVSPGQLPGYLKEKIWVASGVTDVFVWVHGWQNDYEVAIRSAQRLFNGIVHIWKKQKARYTNVRGFTPRFVAVHWPSTSSSFPSGYSVIRDRAHAMTEGGCAEYVLASLLGYLEEDRKHAPRRPTIGTLKASAGYYVHCLGHSFGGRFLGQAITAAADPSAPTLELLGQTVGAPGTLSLLSGGKGFDFTVDSFLVFQMAAPKEIFNDRFNILLRRDKTPLSGPICLTYSRYDTANCYWHEKIEGRKAIGCNGAQLPVEAIRDLTLKELADDYTSAEFLSKPIVNVDASWAYDYDHPLSPSGAHADYWYEESIHLLLGMVNAVRVR